jgi:hypothetical protein
MQVKIAMDQTKSSLNMIRVTLCIARENTWKFEHTARETIAGIALEQFKEDLEQNIIQLQDELKHTKMECPRSENGKKKKKKKNHPEE